MSYALKSLIVVLSLAMWHPSPRCLAAEPDLFALEQDQLPTDISPPDVIEWTAISAELFENGTVLVGLRLSTKQDFNLYAKRVEFKSSSGYLLSRVKGPKTIRQNDPITGKDVDVYSSGDFFLLFSGLKEFTGDTFPLEVRYLGCTKVICLFPYTEAIEVPAYKANSQDNALLSDLQATPKTEDKSSSPQPMGASAIEAATAPSAAVEQSFESKMAGHVKDGDLHLGLLFLLVFLGGLLTNLTPCVYPMIPITIRLLAGQKERPLLGAAFYSLGIIVTYTILGTLAAASGSMFGHIMASVSFNIAFALIMAILGVTMLGYGNLSFLQNLGAKIGSSKGQLRNAFAMGTGAGLVASPCTGPILAALLAYSARQNDLTKSSLLLLCYSTGFGLPYIFLGTAAVRLSKLKVKPALQVFVKLIFAAVMFALSLYYLRIPAYNYLNEVNQQIEPIALLALGLGAGLTLFLLSKQTLIHSKRLALTCSLLLGLGLFASSQWLNKTQSSRAYSDLKWLRSEQEAYDAAINKGGPLLIDMWAEWCEACKKMDATTFSNPKLIKSLVEQNWTLLKLDLTESNEANDLVQERYGIQGLPTLILIDNPAEKETRRRIAGYIDGPGLLKQLKNE